MKRILCVASVLAFALSVYDIGRWNYSHIMVFAPTIMLLFYSIYYYEKKNKKSFLSHLLGWIPVVVLMLGTGYFSIHLRPSLVWMSGLHAQRIGQIEKAKKIWTKGARRGDAASQLSLGGLLEKEGNLSEARNWYKRAAMQGSPDGEVEARRLTTLWVEEGRPVTIIFKEGFDMDDGWVNCE